MKKIILVSLLALMAIASNAQTDSLMTVSELPGAIYKDTKAALAQLAEGLGTTAEYVWPIMIKQQTVASITYLMVNIILLLVIGIFVILLYKSNNHYFDRESLARAIIITGILFLVTFVVTIYDIVTGFVNPEYGAIKEVIEMIK